MWGVVLLCCTVLKGCHSKGLGREEGQTVSLILQHSHGGHWIEVSLYWQFGDCLPPY